MVEERAQRRLAAILAADVVGYSRLMERDETGTLSALKDRRKAILQPLVSEHHGRLVKVMGDGVLVEFASVPASSACIKPLYPTTSAARIAASRRWARSSAICYCGIEYCGQIVVAPPRGVYWGALPVRVKLGCRVLFRTCRRRPPERTYGNERARSPKCQFQISCAPAADSRLCA